MTLYLKYRPQKVEDLDLSRVRDSLKNILSASAIPHAFLFAGPKGTGKTSAARILAKAINCISNERKDIEPCNECSECVAITKGTSMDVIELDAASNRGIDDIRALRDSVALSPHSAKKKIYIIDEAHMLTTEASNAFLKTLEEPPSHVIFIFATTDPQKLPETIKSRLTLVQFTKATPDEVGRQISRVVVGEKLKVEEGVLDLIIKAADGSFRDAVKILESLALSGPNIKKIEAENYLYQGKLNLDELMNLISQKDIKSTLNYISSYSKEGGSIKVCIDELIRKSRSVLLSLSGVEDGEVYKFSEDRIIYLIECLLESQTRLAYSPVPALPLELALTKWAMSSQQIGENISSEQKKTEKIVKPNAGTGAGALDENLWTKILTEIRLKNTAVDALLRAAKPLSFDGSSIVIGVYYRFHKERLEIVQNKRAFEDIASSVLGSEIRVSFELTERDNATPPIKTDPPLTAAVDKDILSAAKEIFGN
jgi:DNA polymerase III subunit gamma/tau